MKNKECAICGKQLTADGEEICQLCEEKIYEEEWWSQQLHEEEMRRLQLEEDNRRWAEENS